MAGPKSLKGLWRSATGYRRARTKPIRADRTGMSAEDRLKRMNTKRLRRERAEIFDEVLFGGGLGISPFSRGAKGAAGGGADAGGGAGGSAGLGDDVDIPALDTPKTATITRKPTISTVVKQLNVILTVAQQISAAMKSQQDALVQKAAVAREATKENAMESRNAEQLQANDSNPEALEPISSSIDKLNNAIDQLSEMIEDKADQSDLSSLLGGGNGLLGGFGKGGGKWSTIIKGVLGTAAVAGTAAMAYSAFSGSSSGLSLASLGSMSTPAGTPSADNVPLSQPTPVSQTDSLADAFGPALKSASDRVTAEKSVSDGDVQKMATPLIDNTLSSSVLKLIPTSGKISANESLDKIMQGDPQGAGVDPASGLGAPLSGIPALSTSISSDLYSKIYGIDPGADPQASRRMAMLRKSVDTAIANKLRPLIKPQAVGEPGDTTSSDATPVATNVSTPGTAAQSSTPGGTPSSAPSVDGGGSTPVATSVSTPGASAQAATPGGTPSQPQDATPVQTNVNDPAIPPADQQAASNNNAQQVSNTPVMPSFKGARDLLDEAYQKQLDAQPSVDDEEIVVNPNYDVKKHPILKFLQRTFAQEKEYISPEKKAFLKQQKLFHDSERRQSFGQDGIRQILQDAPGMLAQASGVGLSSEPLLPSIKPTAPKAGLLEGIGDVPSPDYPLFSQYSGSFFMGDFGG